MRSMRVSRASWIEADSVYFERSRLAEARRASASSRVAIVQGRWRCGRARWKEPGGRRTTRSSKEVVGVGIVAVESRDVGLVEDCDCWDRWVCCTCCGPMFPSQFRYGLLSSDLVVCSSDAWSSTSPHSVSG